MAYSFDDADAADQRQTQYFEMFCNRGIYHQGWTAVTRHSTPWVMAPLPAARGRRLGAVRHDHGLEPVARPGRRDAREARGVAAALAGRRRGKYNVLPLDDRRIERFNSDLAGRPVLVRGNSQLLYGGMGRLTEASILNIKNKSHAVTAEVVVPESGAEGVIIAQGGAFAGWSLYAKDGKPRYCYNLLGLQRFTIERRRADPGRHPPGADGVRLRRRRAREGRHRGALRRRDHRSARAASTGLSRWSSRPTRRPTSAGTPRPRSATTTPARPASSPARVNWVQIDLGEDAEDADHLITPEERLRVAMARQ